MSNQEKSTTDTVLDTVQGALDLIGLIPVIGDACDLINAGISLARGDFTGAAISLVAMIPGLGAAGPLLKALNKLPPGVLKAITDILAKLGDLFSKVPFWKIVDGAKGILDELLTLIEKHLPELGKMLREFCCDKLGMACFIAGTLIHTPGGSVPIEDIRPGDLVFAQNPDTGELGVKRVENTFVREVYVTYDLHFESESLTTTAEHPFWVYGKGFKTADELMAGDEILWG